MTIHKPLILNEGQIEELQNGDTLKNVSGSQAHLEVKDEGVLKQSNVDGLIFDGAGTTLTDVGNNQLDIDISNGGSNAFKPTYPIITALKDITVIGTQTENFSIVGGTNDKLLIKFDQSTTTSTTVTLTAGTRTAQQICDDINFAFHADSVYHDTYEYAVVENAKVKLRSLRHVYAPEILIETIANNAYTTLGFTTGTNSGVEQKIIRLHNHKIMLPDNTIQTVNSLTELDITNDSDLENESIIATASQTIFNFNDMKLETIKQTIDPERPDLHLRFNNNVADIGKEENIYSSLTGILFSSIIKKLGSHSIVFDGSTSLINFGNILNYERSDEFSIEGWLYINSAGNGTLRTLVGNRKTTGNNEGWEVNINTSNGLEFKLQNDSGINMIVSTTSAIATDVMKYVVIVCDGSSNRSGMKIYIDNVIQTLTTSGASTLTGTLVSVDNLYIGYNAVAVGQYYYGNIDGLIAHSKELTVSEIRERWSGGNGVQYSDYGVNVKRAKLITTGWNNTDNSSGSGAIVTNNNVTFLTTPTKMGSYSMDFNGSSSKFSIPNSDFNPSKADAFAISMWIWWDTVGDHMSIYGNTAVLWNGCTAYVRSAGSIRIHYAKTNSNRMFVYTGSGVATAGSWIHLVVAYDGTGSANGIKVYKNSIPQSLTVSNTIGSYDITTTQPWSFGIAAGKTYFNGKMENVKIYQKVLTQDDVDEDYNSGNGKYYSYTGFNPAELNLHVNNNIVDASQNNYSGTNNNVTFSAITKKLGSHSAQFNGTTSNINLGDNLKFDSTDLFTLETWVYPDSTGGASEIFSKVNNFTNKVGYYLSCNNSNGNINFQLVNTLTTNMIDVSKASALTVNTLNHLVVVYDGLKLAAGVKIYVNGVPQILTVNTNNLTGSIANTGNLLIGQGPSGYLKGYLDEIVFFAKELTSSEINKRYYLGNGREYVFGEEYSPKFKVLVNSIQKTFDVDYILSSETQIIFLSGLVLNDVVKIIIKIIGDNWYYLYGTNDGKWTTKKCFISNQNPTFLGEHPKSNINGKYLGSFFANTLNTIRAMFKKGIDVLLVPKIIYNALKDTSTVVLDVSEEIPPTTRIIKLLASAAYGTYTHIRNWPRSDGSSLEGFRNYGPDGKTKDYYCNEDQELSFERVGVDTVITIKTHGYSEDVHAPLSQ